MLFYTVFICFLAGAGAGIGTGFAGMSAAAVISPMLAAFLEAASGAQAATLNAMKSACDNAKESRQKLEVKIYRSRQASVTQSVLETSVDFSENDW